MNKKEIIKKIKEDTDCGNEEAEDIFRRAIEGGMVKREINWRFINRVAMYLSVPLLIIWVISIYL
tara:strand:- start:2159 stop:2353 length:195 start_codon:yes stop_codon:yes gene_type:complete